MYDLKLTLHKHQYAQTCDFLEDFKRTVSSLAYNKALCSLETYDDKAIIYVSSLQSNTVLHLQGIACMEVERGNFDKCAAADMATLTSYFSEDHATELVLSKLKNNRRYLEGTILTTRRIEITKELLKQFDWDDKTYDDRQVLLEHLLPAVTDTQCYTNINIVGADGPIDPEDHDIARATVEELFGPDASDYW